MSTLTPNFRLFAESMPWPLSPDGKPFDSSPFVKAMEVAVNTIKQSNEQPNYVINFDQTPVGLRWTMMPGFGFPRRPFRVYRRRKLYKNEYIIDSPIRVNTHRESPERFDFSSNEMYLLTISVELSVGQTLWITAYDRQGRPLPGKEPTLTASGRVSFRSPFMAGLSIGGTGIINFISGVTTSSVLEADDWQLIQVVGLPFPRGRTMAYNDELQGFASALAFPDQAAWLRLLMGGYIMPKPPALGDPSLATPAWLPPDPVRYIEYLTQDSSSLLFDIQKCLENTADDSWNPAARQPAFFAERVVSGIHQHGVSPATSGVARFPVVGSTLLQVSSDSFGALALGYGTYDFANQLGDDSPGIILAQTVTRGYDYKVEAPFTLRPDFEFSLLGKFGSFPENQIFVALSEDLVPPVLPVSLGAPTLRVNRPVELDGVATEAVKISWRVPELPTAWGIVRSDQSEQREWLNTENFFAERSYQPYLTREPQNEEPGRDTGRLHFVDTELELPLFGSKNTRYFLAGIDLFGRWSAFREIPHTGRAIPAQRPVIHSVKLVLPNTDGPFPPPTPATLNLNLEVEFSWDWSDRRAAQIQLAGQFFPAKTTPPAAAPAGFAIHSNNAPHPLVTITFDLEGNPVSTDLGTVTRLLQEVSAPDDDPQLPPVLTDQYRLVVENLTAVFPPGDPHAVAYAVYIRGLERVRVPALQFSPWPPILISPPGTSPEVFLPISVAEIADPRLPAVVSLPAEVQFTAFPDATKIARGRLNWAGAANAIGYIVWEASETAIRTALDAHLKAQFPDDTSRHLLEISSATLVERATQLRTLLAEDEYAQLSAKAFSRYNKDLLPISEVELEINGSADGLTIFRVSSVNRSNLESQKSAPVFFAVPRLNRPFAPNLLVKPNGSGVELLVQGNAPRAQSAGYRVYRIRKTPVSSDIGAKGRPVILETNTAWELTPQTVAGEDRLSGRILDSLADRNWKPLFYQVTAVGSGDAAQGIYSGESVGSPTRETYFPPESLPRLEWSAMPPTLPTLSLQTDIPFFGVRLGPALIELFSLEIDLTAGARKTLLKQWKAANIQFEQLPSEVPRIENIHTESATGITTFDLLLDSGTRMGMVRVTDPLGRSSAIFFGNP